MERQLDISKVSENCGMHAIPLLHNGVLYVAEYSTYLRAISVDTGNEISLFKTNGPIMSSPKICGDALYFGSFDNCVYAVSLNCKLLWKFETGDRVASSPAIYNGLVYIGSSDNNLYALNAKTGKEVWRFRTGDEIVGDVLIHANRIFFGSMDSHFYCLDLSGNLVWKFRTGDSIITGTPVADDNYIYFGSSDETIYALSLDGKFIWGFKTGDTVFNKPTLNNGVLYCGSRDGHMYAINAKAGVCIWRFNTASGYPVASTPLITDNAVYFGADKFYALNLQGFLLWSFQLKDLMVSKPIIGNNMLLFGGLDGHIRALSLTGMLVWDKLTKSSVKWDATGLVPPPKHNPDFFEERAKHLGIGVKEFEEKIRDFKPYTFKPDSDIKSYISSDAERYGGISDSVGAYKDAGKGSMGSYSSAERKKKSETDKMLKDQFGIEY